MSLEFDCSSCHRRIKAPESLAGKKARCPQCQGVVDVPEPEPVYQAEEIPFAPLQPETSADGGGRRPCPACGELIVSSALKCRFCGQLFGAGVEPAPTHTGRVVLTRAEAENGTLPSACMQCGAPAAGFQTKQFSWNPPWVWIFLFAGLLPLIVVAMFTTKKIKLCAPFCEEHLNHWKWRSNVVLLGFFGLILGGFALFGVAAAAESKYTGLACGLVAILGVAWLITAAVLSEKSIHSKEIGDASVTLVNVCPEFIAALNHDRSTRPFAPSMPPVSSGSGMPVVAIVVLVAFLAIVGLAAISVIGENRPPPGTVADTSPFIDLQHGYQLRHPGPGWFLMDRNQLARQNPLAKAGAVHGDIGGIILVEDNQERIDFVGNEQELGRVLLDTSPLQDKTLETVEPATVQGRRGLRIQFTARDGIRRVRVQNIVFWNNQRIFQIFTVGPVNTSNRQAFQPFVDAFQLLN